MNNIDITKNNNNADYNKAIMIIIIVKIKIIALENNKSWNTNLTCGEYLANVDTEEAYFK